MKDIQKKWDKINMNSDDLIQKKWEEHLELCESEEKDILEEFSYLKKYKVGKRGILNFDSKRNIEITRGIYTKILDSLEKIEGSYNDYHKYRQDVQVVQSRVLYGRGGTERQVRAFIRKIITDKKQQKLLLKKLGDELF